MPFVGEAELVVVYVFTETVWDCFY